MAVKIPAGHVVSGHVVRTDHVTGDITLSLVPAEHHRRFLVLGKKKREKDI